MHFYTEIGIGRMKSTYLILNGQPCRTLFKIYALYAESMQLGAEANFTLWLVATAPTHACIIMYLVKCKACIVTHIHGQRVHETQTLHHIQACEGFFAVKHIAGFVCGLALTQACTMSSHNIVYAYHHLPQSTRIRKHKIQNENLIELIYCIKSCK